MWYTIQAAYAFEGNSHFGAYRLQRPVSTFHISIPENITITFFTISV